MINDRERKLENQLAQFLHPIRGVFFEVIIKSLYNSEVLKFDSRVEDNSQILMQFVDAMRSASKAVHRKPIVRSRPNEVGNDMEPYVIEALNARKLNARAPETKSGKGKSTGYPDIVVETEIGTVYLEVKTYNKRNAVTTQRSFYFSPSNDPKVHMDGYHLAVGFEMRRSGNEYWPMAFKIVDLYGLECDLKSESNSDNRRLYKDHQVLISEPLVYE